MGDDRPLKGSGSRREQRFEMGLREAWQERRASCNQELQQCHWAWLEETQRDALLLCGHALSRGRVSSDT